MSRVSTSASHPFWLFFSILLTLFTVIHANQNQIIFQESPPNPPSNSYCPGKSLPPSVERTCNAVQFPVQCINNTLHDCLEGFQILYENITTDQSTWDCLSVGNRVAVVDGPVCVQSTPIGAMDGIAAAVQGGFDKVLQALHFGGPGFMQSAVDKQRTGTAATATPPTQSKRASASGSQPDHDASHGGHSVPHTSINENLTPDQITALFSPLDPSTNCTLQIQLELTSADKYCQVQNFFKYWVNATLWNITATPEQPQGKFDVVRVLDKCLA